jgi:hypothetical protein
MPNKWYIFSNLPTRMTALPFNQGSVAVKAAWRILTDKDTPAIRARYYVVPNAQVFDPASRTCMAQDIALVGLHIVTKTPSRPQWIWSTFEHVDNVPGITTEPKPPAGVPFSFYDPGQPPTLSPPAPPVSTTNPPVPDPPPVQVIRQQAIEPKAMAMNEAYWNLPQIKGRVWQNYMLVMTQWPTAVVPESPGNDAVPTPIMDSALSNTTMETYFQSNGGSCMTCHNRSNQQGRDFVMFVTVDAFQPSVPPPPGQQPGSSLSDDPLFQSLVDFFNTVQKK